MTGKPDYDVGDVVVCVDGRPLPCHYNVWHKGNHSFKVGGLYRVRSIGPTSYCPCTAAHFDGFMADATRFRKIDAADEAFTRHMRALKPAKVQA